MGKNVIATLLLLGSIVDTVSANWGDRNVIADMGTQLAWGVDEEYDHENPPGIMWGENSCPWGWRVVKTADIDGDGDADVVGVVGVCTAMGGWMPGTPYTHQPSADPSNPENHRVTITWHENVDGVGGAWAQHVVENFNDVFNCPCCMGSWDPDAPPCDCADHGGGIGCCEEGCPNIDYPIPSHLELGDVNGARHHE